MAQAGQQHRPAIRLSAEQIRAFTQVIHGNNRPTQPLNGRCVVTDAIGIKLP